MGGFERVMQNSILEVKEKVNIEEVKKDALYEENNKVALGICFGSGIGIFLGALLGNVALGLGAGGSLGVVVALILQVKKNINKTSFKK